MSVLTDIFTSLSNKIRSKLGTSISYTPTEAISAIDDVYTAGEAAGISETKVGTAVDGDVLSGKTFTNSSTVGVSGTMTNNGAVSQSLNCGGSYTIPAGYHNGSGTVTANSLASQTGVDSGKTAVTAGAMVSGYQGWVNGSKISGTFAGQEKTVTAGTSAASVTPDSGKYLTKVTYNPTPSQSKSASPSTSAQTISPDSGKLLSSVSISAISPQRAAGVAATYTGIDSTGPYVYFPYGWHPNTNSSYGNYTRLTAAQAVTACPKQEKTVTAGTSAASVTPDSGKLLSKVTYNPTPSETKTQAPGTSAINVTPSSGKLLSKVTVSAISPQRSNGTYATSVGINSTAPFVYFPYGWWDNNWNNSSFCYLTTAQAQALHNHSTTYTPTSNSSASDMGVQHNYRYVNTNTVYNQGYNAGADADAARYQRCRIEGNGNVIGQYYLSGRFKGIKIPNGVWFDGDARTDTDWITFYDNSWVKVGSSQNFNIFDNWNVNNAIIPDSSKNIRVMVVNLANASNRRRCVQFDYYESN